MKKLLFIILFSSNFFAVFSQSNLPVFFKKADLFFKTYVKNGAVNYDQISKNKTDLKSLIQLSNQITVNKSNANNFKSFWINTYNLGVIEQITDNYPVSSPMEVSGFFNQNKRNLGGKNITLNDIENKLLRGNFNEPRFHFVLVCGAISCPPIVDFAYTPENLEQQLEQQTKLALNNPDFIRSVNNKITISEIFKWYSTDFGNNKSKVTNFINSYRVQKIHSSFGYYPYNWQLNKQNNNTEASTKPVLSNVQSFTPSKLLSKGQFDIKLFNNLYTETKSADSDGIIRDNNSRDNFFTSTLEFYYGITKNSRINIGFIGQVRSNTFGQNALSVFKFEDNGFDPVTDARSGLTRIAPSIRIQPFVSIPTFSFTSSLYFPVFEKDKAQFLDFNSYIWETKFFYDRTFGQNKWQIFTQFDFTYNFGEQGFGERFANNSIVTPFSAFLSYFPTAKSTIFINAQQFFLTGLNENKFNQEFTSLGAGAKYQITNELNLELSYNTFVRGTDTGIGTSLGLGLRYLSPN